MELNDMIPRSPADNVGDARPTHAVFSSQSALCNSHTNGVPYCSDGVIIQLVSVDARSTCLLRRVSRRSVRCLVRNSQPGPTLLNHVPSVISATSQEKMVRTNTGRIVAPVKNAGLAWIADKHGVAHSMCETSPTWSNAEAAVATGIHSPSPFPAAEQLPMKLRIECGQSPLIQLDHVRTLNVLRHLPELRLQCPS